jgi:hypothetical protein
MNRTYIGLDPGKGGALVAIYPTGGMIKRKFPTIGKEYDVNGLRKLIDMAANPIGEDFFEGPHQPIAIIEDVHAIFGSAAGATFTFGFGKGLLIGIVAALGLPYCLVQPKIWQKEMYQGIPEIRKPGTETAKGYRQGPLDTKKMSLMAAQRIYPNVDLRATERAVNPDEGIVDALLLATFAMRKGL